MARKQKYFPTKEAGEAYNSLAQAMTRERSINMERNKINLSIAKHLGYWIYHYDKSYESSNYFILVDEDFEPVVYEYGDSYDGERKTEEEAIADVPKWIDETDFALRLIEDENLFCRIDCIGYDQYDVTLKKSKHSRRKGFSTSTIMSEAICRAYIEYHGIDLSEGVELEVH